MEEEEDLSEVELENKFFRKLSDLTLVENNQKYLEDQMSNKRKFFDCNNVHNFMDDFDGPQSQKDWGVLREIDLNEGFNYKFEFNQNAF